MLFLYFLIEILLHERSNSVTEWKNLYFNNFTISKNPKIFDFNQSNIFLLYTKSYDLINVFMIHYIKIIFEASFSLKFYILVGNEDFLRPYAKVLKNFPLYILFVEKDKIITISKLSFPDGNNSFNLFSKIIFMSYMT